MYKNQGYARSGGDYKSPFSLFREFIDWLREDERFAGETSLW